jgi:hypothetical protein
LTIAISIKINDGLVLATDSASTLLAVPAAAQDPNPQPQVFNVYNNADKLFNLQKGLPIGAITWGAGSIGQASITTIMKDLRKIFRDGDEEKHPKWKIEKRTYTVLDIAEKLKRFVFDELYSAVFNDSSQARPPLGFIVAGYSADAPMADEYMIEITDGVCKGPQPVRTREQIGMAWGGQSEALDRLVVGVGMGLPKLLEASFRLSPEQLAPVVQNLKQNLQVPLVVPAMPLQDAIDLAEFLVDMTIKFSRFMPGPPTVGGPIEIAAISKHEGFRWIKRKYYFNHELNPEEVFRRTWEPTDKEVQPQTD